jgi:TrmH family RNA methyltransferase
VELISSTNNRRVVEAAKLHRSRERRDTGRTLLEGPHNVAEALAGGAEVQALFTLDAGSEVAQDAALAGVDVFEVAPVVLAKVAATEHPRGPVAVLAVPPSPPLARRDTVVLVDVADPGNVGTVIRSAAAFGFQVALVGSAADPWAPKVLRAAAGGHFRVPVCVLAGPDDLVRAGLRMTALVPSPEANPGALNRRWPTALLVGSEAHGLPAVLVGACDSVVTLPMPGGVESLNVAVAASIAMYERLRLTS